MPIRLVIADEYELLREGIKAHVARESDMAVVGEASDGMAALELCRALAPDVAVLDLKLPGLDGLAVCRHLQQEMPQVAVLILASTAAADQAAAAVRAGARGYIIKDVSGSDLNRHIRLVAGGSVAMDPRVVEHFVNRMREPEAESREGGDAKSALSRQQVAIIRLVAEGYTNKEIAEQLFLSEKTVKGYLADALRRLGARNRVEAAMIASREGWI